jgi:hypothetical protein
MHIGNVTEELSSSILEGNIFFLGAYISRSIWTIFAMVNLVIGHPFS